MIRCGNKARCIWTLTAVSVVVAGCTTPAPPRPPSHFELAKQAVGQKDFRRAGQEFENFANQEHTKLKNGGDLKWIRNTVLAYRDAANNYQLAGDTDVALRALEMCVSQMATFADGHLCEARGVTLLKEPAVTPARASQFQKIAAQFATVREQRRTVVQADIEARQRQAEQAQREWQAAAPEREWQQERDRIERDLSFAQASEQMLTAARKDASMLRMQRQLLESNLADHDRKKPSPAPVQIVRTPSPAPTSAGTVSASAGCKTTFAHLAPRLPEYRVAELQRARAAILAEDLTQTLGRAKSMGFSAAAAAAQSLQAADNADREVSRATACIRTFATDPEPVVRSLERGTYAFSGSRMDQLNIHASCAAQYVLLKYTAIATREGAVQMACMAQAK